MELLLTREGLRDGINAVTGRLFGIRIKEEYWIEIELIDKSNNPVPNAEYIILSSNGKEIVNGVLDNNGYALVNGLEKMEYQIVFPK